MTVGSWSLDAVSTHESSKVSFYFDIRYKITAEFLTKCVITNLSLSSKIEMNGQQWATVIHTSLSSHVFLQHATIIKISACFYSTAGISQMCFMNLWEITACADQCLQAEQNRLTYNVTQRDEWGEIMVMFCMTAIHTFYNNE